MKRFLLLLLLLAYGTGRAEYWESPYDTPSLCKENHPGSFVSFTPTDNLNVRVFSAALPHLTTVTEEEIQHFAQICDVDAQTIDCCYYTALGNCLWADILITPVTDDLQEQHARTVLLLFLTRADSPEALAQMRAIQQAATDDTLTLIAAAAGVPVEFVRILICPA